jgi:uncharacterized protein (TIGR03067 family)
VNEETLFHLALAKPPGERAAFLDGVCAGNTELRERVEALLQAHDNPGSFLNRPVDQQLATSAFQSAGTPRQAPPTSPIEGQGAAPAAAGQAGATQAEAAPSDLYDLSFLAAPTKAGLLGRLGHYEIQQVIGKGSFGIVLKGFDERLHRVVAIKVLSPAFAANGSARKRFIREARAAAAVKNEHVVGIYDVQEEAQPPYLVMECIDGISLQDKLDKHGSFGVKEILRIGMQIAEGLTSAHKQGLVHRDIKPANILLENGVERVKITDFGLARAVDDASVTQSGTVAGTPMYMSPEQAEGLPIDHRSDLFSLGTVLYAMCTGHPPFRASGTHAVLKRVIDASPRPIREINSEIPDWLCTIIAKLHAKKPEDRIQTAKEIGELLGHHLAHLQQPQTHALPAPMAPPAPTPQGAPKKRHRILAAAVFCLALLFSAFVFMPGLGRYLLNQSSLKFASNFNEAKMVVMKDGAQVAILSDAESEIHLSPGTYSVEIQAAPSMKIQGCTVSYYSLYGAWLGNTELTEMVRDTSLDPPPVLPRLKGYNLVLARGRQALFTINMFPETPLETAKTGWVQLFNGKDLDGWAVSGPWEIEDYILKGRFGFAFSKRDNYENFHLRVEAKINAGGNSGVFFRCKPVIQGAQPGYEADINMTAERRGWTGALYRYPSPAPLLQWREKEVTQPDEWFLMEVIAIDKKLTVKVNGVITAEVDDDTYARGHLALQATPKATVVQFKKIEIKELPPTYKDDKERLQGRWVAESVEVDQGKQLPDEMRAQLTLTFTGNTMRATMPQAEEATFHLDETAKPKQIDIIGADRKGRFGIYRFDGNRLVLCMGEDDKKDRPTEFTSKGGTKRMLGVFKNIEIKELPPTPPPLPQQPADVLPFFVGSWKVEGLVIEPVLPGGLDARATATASFEFVAGGKFLRSFKTETRGLFETLTLQSWDPKEQTFGSWHFDSSGYMRDPVVGSWDPGKRLLTFKGTIGGGFRATHEYTLIDGRTVKVYHVVRDPDDKIAFEGRDTMTRLDKPLTGQHLPSDLKRPPEMTVLDRLVGAWETKGVIKTQDNLVGLKFTTRVKSRKILGGRMIASEEAGLAGHDDAYWLAAFDERLKAYRFWMFNAAGNVMNLGGSWDEADQKLKWNSAAPDGSNSSAIWHWCDPDHREWTTLIRDAVGKTVLDIQATSIRQSEPPAKSAGRRF